MTCSTVMPASGMRVGLHERRQRFQLALRATKIGVRPSTCQDASWDREFIPGVLGAGIADRLVSLGYRVDRFDALD